MLVLSAAHLGDLIMSHHRNRTLRYARAILGPGRSEHNGRGCYEMHGPATDSEIWERTCKFMQRHADKIANVQIDKTPYYEVFEITLIDGYGGGSYSGKDDFYRTIQLVWNDYAANNGQFTIEVSVVM